MYHRIFNKLLTMYRFAGILLLAVVLLPNQKALSQVYTLDHGYTRFTFDFEFVNNLIVVPVTINGQYERKFLLDTGVRSTILTDKSDVFSRQPNSRQVQIAGVGHIRNIDAFMVEDVTIALPGISGKQHSIVVLEEDYLNLSSHLGTDVHGILGYEFFESFVVRIDYIKRNITVYQYGYFKPARRLHRLPISIEQGRPYLEATIKNYKQENIEAKLLIDSGASHGLLLELDSDVRITLPDSVLQTIIGWGLGGELTGYLGRVEALKINEFVFDDMLTSFTYGYSDPRLFELLGRKGSIGGELLGRFTTIYDYKNEVVYLRSNFNLKRKFEFNLSGIDLIAEGKNYKTFRIINVIEGSPAQEAGLKPDDIILRANYRYAANLTLTELNNMLRTRPGRRIDMVVFRSGEFIQVRFHLQRLI
jgi:hypothetical protein